jgi:hypothetical protein
MKYPQKNGDLQQPSGIERTDQDHYPPASMEPLQLTKRQRLFCALAGLFAWGLLLIASQLEPDPSGRGTHRQLGLPPCSFILFLGVPCPGCGMTTSWTLATNGRLVEAWTTNAAGTLLAVFCSGIGLFGLLLAFHGRLTKGLMYLLSSHIPHYAIAILVLIAFLDWLHRLFQI